MEGCCHWVWRPRLEVSSVSTWTLDSLSLGYTVPHQKASIILTVVPLEGTYHSSWAASRVFSVSFLFSSFIMMFLGFPGGSDGKESACNARDLSSIPGLGRSPGEGHGNPLQYSCLETPMDRGAWWVTVQGCKELDMTEVTQHACIVS